jgi:hypothetical protein
MQSRIRILAGPLAAVLTASVGVTGVAQTALGLPGRTPTSALPTSLASTPPVLGGTNLSTVSSAVSVALSQGATGPVFLAAHGNDLALAQASANASQSNGLALSASGSDSASVLAQLDPLNPDAVELVGPPTAFPQALIDAVGAEYNVGTAGVGPRTIEWSLAADDPSQRARIVVGNPNVTNSAETAASLATATGAALVLTDGTEPSGALAEVLDDPSNELITVMGGNTALTTFDQLAETAGDRIASLDVTNLADAELAVAFETVAAGSSTRKVVASSTQTASGYATAALVARYTGGIAVSAANAKQYINLLAAPLTAKTAVGVGASTTTFPVQSAQVNPAPAFRVTNTTVSTTTFSVTHTGYSGAARYAAYDLEGNEVATSSTTTIAIPGTPESTAIAALDSAGDPIATLQYKVNEYETSADRSQAVIASTSGATNHLVFLGAENLPRLVTRTPISITGEAPDPANDTVNVALTCASTFTDASQPKTWQYLYRITTLSKDPAACEAAGVPGDSTIRDVAGVTFPATEYPMFASMSADIEDEIVPADSSAQATGSVLERAIVNQFASAEAKTSRATTFAPGDDWAPMKFRYQAFIPESKLFAPGISGSLSRPFQFFHGDNRWEFNPNGSYRYRQDATVTFGSGHYVQYQEWMGQSIKYACRWPNGSDCVEMQRKTAPTTELWIQDISHTNTSARFTMAARASNPLHALAPPIDGGVGFNLKRGVESLIVV